MLFPANSFCNESSACHHALQKMKWMLYIDIYIPLSFRSRNHTFSDVPKLETSPSFGLLVSFLIL